MARSNKNKRSSRPGAQKKGARHPRSYTPLSDALSRPFTFADTELSEGIQRHSLRGLLAAAMRRNRRSDAEPLQQVLCALLIWPLLKVESMHCFCAELCQFLSGKVSVLYDFLGREDINSKARYKTASLVVSINLQTQTQQPAHWVEVRLVFSAPVRECSADTWGHLSLHGCDPPRCENPGSLRAALVHRSLLQGDQTKSGVPERTERTL